MHLIPKRNKIKSAKSEYNRKEHTVKNCPHSALDIPYKPLFSGTHKTRIAFFNSEPDLDFLLDSPRKKLFVTDSSVFALPSLEHFFKQFSKQETGTHGAVYSYGKTGVQHSLIVIPAGEINKTIESVLAIVKTALDFSLTRKDIFTAIGGGVVTDITAFAASIFKRGASCDFVPTTLLAMVDAAIGGKSGCDFDAYKNSIGTFFPAASLYVFPDFIQTLPEKEFISGFAEALKTALLFGRKLYAFIKENREKILSRDKETVFKIIESCAKAKADIVKKDLAEKNKRMLLNLGHTFGHALESRAGFGRLTHGECVAWGISRALKASEILGLCTSEYYAEVCSVLNSFGYETSPMHSAFSEPNEILSAMKNDKKNSSAKVRLILQKDCGKNVIAEVPDEIIIRALKTE